MKVEIITPDQSLFNGEAKAVSMPGIDGNLGILDNHAPLITALKAGDVKVTVTDGSDKFFTLKGGTAEVLNNKVLILAE